MTRLVFTCNIAEGPAGSTAADPEDPCDGCGTTARKSESIGTIAAGRPRNTHFCDACYRAIDPGEKYVRVFGVWMGDMFDAKRCAHCDAVLRIYDPCGWDGEWSVDTYGEWSESGWKDPRCRGPYGTLTEFSLSELKARAGYRMRWRYRYSKKLLPVPTVQGGS